KHPSVGARRRSRTSAPRWILCRNLLSKPALAKAAGRGIGAQVELVTRRGSNCPAHRPLAYGTHRTHRRSSLLRQRCCISLAEFNNPGGKHAYCDGSLALGGER